MVGVSTWEMGFNQRIITHLAVVQDHDPAAAHHCVEAMGDDESGAAGKLTANGLLDETIRLGVNGCCCLIQYQDLMKQCRGNTKRSRQENK